jgi:hypothetical protein
MQIAPKPLEPEAVVFFRGDTPEVTRKLIVGAVLATMGALLVLGSLAQGLAERAGIPESLRVTASLLGSLSLLLGLLLGFVSVPQALFAEVTLEFRVSAICIEWGREKREEIAWDDIRDVRADGKKILFVTEHQERRIAHRFGGKTHAQFAALVAKNKLRVRMGLPLLRD